MSVEVRVGGRGDEPSPAIPKEDELDSQRKAKVATNSGEMLFRHLRCSSLAESRSILLPMNSQLPPHLGKVAIAKQ